MIFDVVVIGAGQAGLSIGYFLKKANVSFLILDEASMIGESWRKRYDSLTLFTPRSYSSLPGLPFDGDSNKYPTKDDVAEYLSLYVHTFSLPVQLNTVVEKLTQTKTTFMIKTNKEEIAAKMVVAATGPFQNPFIPEFSKMLSDQTYQVHSSSYKNPNQLKDGSVLVIGGGNSGAQIAVELAKEREVHLSVGSNIKFLPQNLLNKSIFWWFDKLGILSLTVQSKLGQLIKKQPDPIFGLELKSLIKKGAVTIIPRATSVINDHIAFSDGTNVKIQNVIWSTGFKSNYEWIDIPNLFNKEGFPLHQRGITPIEGLYFLGLPWMYRRGSALLQGIGDDAEYIFSQIKSELDCKENNNKGISPHI
ncbi:NAD(P)/FAD-dependent oxidoreductase [Metabacillus dongyingensis]|uniref:flavin-containing monooxygenase n=1 Tax=Metabacillus dongyingensis TaxID=2874282 RepID=UPI003B8B43F6